MIELKDLERLAREKEEENYRFRTYLKTHADEKKLDKEFKMLHEKYFKIYDCSKCRNCCKTIGVSMQEDELLKICKFYNLDIDEVKNMLVEKYGKYINKDKSCPFLEDKTCKIAKCLPRTCKEYPYTNKSERIDSLLTVVQNSKVCPVVYEILEELKRIYKFRSKR